MSQPENLLRRLFFSLTWSLPENEHSRRLSNAVGHPSRRARITATSVRKRERKELTLRRRFWTDRTRDLHSLLETRESYSDSMRHAF